MYTSHKIEPHSTGVLLWFTTNGRDDVVFCTADKDYLVSILGEPYSEIFIGTVLNHKGKKYKVKNLYTAYSEREGFACEDDNDLYFGKPASYFFNIYMDVDLIS